MQLMIDMPASARRNVEAADALDNRRFHVAGYLYGLAAECAVKAMLLELGIRPLARSAQQKDPHYRHFPELRTAAIDVLSGRRSGTLSRMLAQHRFMEGWSTNIRYAAAGQISIEIVTRWRDQAKQAVASIGS